MEKANLVSATPNVDGPACAPDHGSSLRFGFCHAGHWSSVSVGASKTDDVDLLRHVRQSKASN